MVGANIGLQIQERLSSVDRYNKWIYQSIRPYLGNRILDVGCAIGNITRYFLDRELVMGLDVSDEFIERIAVYFSKYPNFKAVKHDISDEKVLQLKNEKIDTVVCLNVLEHIKDDNLALQNIYEILSDCGRLILLVPAIKLLYGTMDSADNHFRRYSKKEIRTLIANCGFSIQKHYFMNFCKYSKLYLALQFSASMSASLSENSDLAEFIPLDSIINFSSSIMKEQASETTIQSSIESIKSDESNSTLELNSRFGISLSSDSISIRVKLKFLLILS